MEMNEAQELQEHAEHVHHEQSLRPVAFTMSVLAVLVAITTVVGHRTHTQAVLVQNKATDQWNEYQSKKIRAYDTQLAIDLLKVVPVADKGAVEKKTEEYRKHQEKWEEELTEIQEKARGYEEQVEVAERKANWFDLGEALLEIGLVVTSVTLLTRRRLYWFFGLAFSLVGIGSAVTGLLVK